jgi:hypothetical protein
MQAERLITSSGLQLQGRLLITPRVFSDDRGFFFESWNQRAFAYVLEADGQAVKSFSCRWLGFWGNSDFSSGAGWSTGSWCNAGFWWWVVPLAWPFGLLGY